MTDNIQSERRVPVCSINWCCPYRNDLCHGECSGERKSYEGALLISGDEAFIKKGGMGPFVRYAMPEKTKAVLRGFDEGLPTEALVGEVRFEVPTPKVIQ